MTSASAHPARAPLRVGLTGGIATGKSEVDRMLSELGARVIDADEVVHALLASDPDTIREVTAAFGGGVLEPGGAVDRKALGKIVFNDPEARAILNKILHPRTREALEREIEKPPCAGEAPIVVVDAALLVESGYHRDFDRLVVVSASTDRQIDRLMERDGLHREEALARIAAQWPTEAKLAAADYRLQNDGTLEALREQVRRLYVSLLEDLRRKEKAAWREEVADEGGENDQ